MNYKKIIPIVGCLLCAIAFGAGKDHDNNIIYKDGEPMHITSKKGVKVELAEDAGVDFSVEKGDATILKANNDGLAIKDKLLEVIINEEIDKKLANLEDLLSFVKAFRVDYAAFKELENSRFSYVYNDIGHTSLTDLSSNETVLAFASITRNGKTYSQFRTAAFANGTGFLASATGAGLFKLTNGADPTLESSWELVNISFPDIPVKTGNDKQDYFGKPYFRSIYYNDKDGKWYGLRQAYGIWSYDGTTWRRESIVDQKGNPKTDTYLNTYHLAIGADNTMIATTEFGPAYKKPGENVWHIISIPGLTNSDGTLVAPARAIATGSSFVVEASTEREVRLTRDLGINSNIPGIKSRFVLGSTGGQGIWYSDPTNILSWTKGTTINPSDGKRGAEEGSFRQIAYHDGTFVAPIHYSESNPSAPTSTKKGIYYSTDGMTWKLSEETFAWEGQESAWYEPQFALGMFIVPTPWSKGKLAVCTDPTKAKWQLISGTGYGYKVVNTGVGAITVSPYGLSKINSSAYFVSGAIPSKNDVYTKAEVDELIRKAIEEIINSRSMSLQ